MLDSIGFLSEFKDFDDAIGAVVRTAKAHGKDSGMQEYGFFIEQMARALYAVDCIKEKFPYFVLTEEQMNAFDYCNDEFRPLEP